MNKKKYVLSISIFLNVVLILGSYLLFRQLGGSTYFKQKILDKSNITASNAKATWYDQLPIKENSIIMLGDSLIADGVWDELSSNENFINRGIGGNTTSDVINRLNEVVKRKPSKVFIMVGINDLSQGLSNKTIIENYKTIINEIKVNKDTKIYINSILPINTDRKAIDVSNVEIVELNKDIKGLCDAEDVSYINIYDKFVYDGQLNSELTFDGLHVNANGYNLWVEELKKYNY